mmetsp:Transcript_18770/g.46499  ORF Transcript_18770/g.46499 Transcript_18770/m.46499 type:complete len:466 (-) Transcript_18770:49-1446(-)
MKAPSISHVLLFLIISLSSFPHVTAALRKLGTNLTSVTFIGDLHADVGCAKEWVQKTGLINVTSTPYKWLGDPEKDALVFLGDYVDKGSSSASVLQFVKNLQETFPDNVLTILGNHDFFLILDTALSFSKDNPHPLGFPFYDYAYSFMHPEEYLESEWVETRTDDEEIYGVLMTALQNAYAKRMEGSVHLCAPECNSEEQVNIFETIAPFTTNPELAKKTQDRLGTWRSEYAKGLFDSGLLQWMTNQPLVAVVGDALIVHGGVSKQVVNYMASLSTHFEIDVAQALQTYINEPFHEFFESNFKNVTGPNSIEGRMTGGYITELILDLVQHRGYFDRKSGCSDVNHVINTVNSEELQVKRIVVGHTPNAFAREMCGGKLLASDSSLSRPFRAFGNMYCPLSSERAAQYSKGASCGATQEDSCDGSISRMTRPSAKDPWPTEMERYLFDELKPLSEVMMDDILREEL